MLDHDEDPIPFYTRDLLARLDALYPQRCVRAGESLEEAHRYAGGRDLIDHLLQWQEDTIEAEREAPGRS